MKRLSIIGCGGIGGYHLEHFLSYTDVELAGFCDIVPERAESFVKKAGRGKAFTDFREMYDTVKPDMVFICVPPYAHGEIEFETIERGIPMFVEKPVALDLSLAKRIQAKIEERGLITAVGFQCRYDKEINTVTQAYITNNPIVTVQGSRVGGMVGVEWFRKKGLSGGQIVEQAIHQFDILRFFLGEAASVYTVARHGIINGSEWPGYDIDDASITLITFKSGIVCSFMTGCYSLNGASWDSKLTFGSKSSRLDYVLCSRVTVYGADEKDIAPEAKGIIKGDGTQRKSDSETGLTYRSETDFGALCDRTFVDAVMSGDAAKILSPYSDAVKTLELVLKCNESMKTGLPVVINA